MHYLGAQPVHGRAERHLGRPEDVAARIPCGPDVRVHVDGIRHFVDAGFTPAGARSLVRDATHDLSVRVIVALPPPPPKRPTLVSASRAHRQHRRKTWAENLARYALP
mgnify:CR=1 FL=1